MLLLAAALSFTASSAVSAEEDSQAAGPQPNLTFEVLSDIHVQKWDTLSHDKLKRALLDLQTAEPGAEAMVINGDLGDGMPGDYDALRKLMNSQPHPSQVFYNIGNHEFYKAWHDADGYQSGAFPNGETEQASQQRFLDFAGRKKLYGDAWVTGYHFIFLGSERYRQSDSSIREDAWLSNSQLAWLEKTLADREEPNRPIFVFLHQPLPYTVAGSQTEWNSRGVVQYKQLRDILTKHPQVFLFSGHTHWELKSKRTLVRDGFTMVGSSSVNEPYNETDIAYDKEDDRSEGLAVEVFGNRVLIRGRDFTNGAWIPEAQFEVTPAAK
jgi:3',5'-cyclic AMP phosphodiesterase CpdA